MTSTRGRIGFMQGRLSPVVDGRVQAFPWGHWQQEFAAAAQIGLNLMEWTIDQDRISENPLMTEAGRSEIAQLSAESGILVRSLTGDCFMQAPFWKCSGSVRDMLVRTLDDLLEACTKLEIRYVVIPLVDNGSLNTSEERNVLEQVLLARADMLRESAQVVAFESDYAPTELAKFIDGFPSDCFGINYDIGNSASLGWDPGIEIPLLQTRIVNVHVKDRLLGGTTVPLGTGSANLPRVFAELKAAAYDGDYILQTARAVDGDHAAALARYRQFVSEQIG